MAGKRLMILGAGPFQAPAIRKAASHGCYVITVDYLPANIGHQFGHEYVNCSTVDQEEVLKAARALNIDGICTFSSDVAVPTVANVCARLGLPGASPTVAETMATKHCFRTFLSEARLTCPRFVSGNSLGSVVRQLEALKAPVIFKPVDTSGSRGVTRLDRLDTDAVERAFLSAQRFSRSRTVCVEEFVEGTEVGGDAVLIDGRVGFIVITHKHLQGFVVTGHRLPTNIGPDDQARVIAQIEATCAALGYQSGSLNFDAIVSSDSVTILEMSPRNGGNGIAAVIERATGVDVESVTIHLALGEKPELPERTKALRGAGSLVFGSTFGGILKHICPEDQVRRRTPELFDLYYAKRPGDLVEPFVHNGNLLGLALLDCRHASDYERFTRKILHALEIIVQPQ